MWPEPDMYEGYDDEREQDEMFAAFEAEPPLDADGDLWSPQERAASEGKTCSECSHAVAFHGKDGCDRRVSLRDCRKLCGCTAVRMED